MENFSWTILIIVWAIGSFINFFSILLTCLFVNCSLIRKKQFTEDISFILCAVLGGPLLTSSILRGCYLGLRNNVALYTIKRINFSLNERSKNSNP
jgi:hypothetical protein